MLERQEWRVLRRFFIAVFCIGAALTSLLYLAVNGTTINNVRVVYAVANPSLEKALCILAAASVLLATALSLLRKQQKSPDANVLYNIPLQHEQCLEIRNLNADNEIESARRAVKHLEHAGGYSTAMNNLAVLLEVRRGTKRDIPAAMRLYQRAIQVDQNPAAVFNLGLLLKCSDASYVDAELADRMFDRLTNEVTDVSDLDALIDRVEQTQKHGTSNPSEDDEEVEWHFELEKVNNSLAYVKLVSPRSRMV